MHDAIESGNLEIVKFFIQQGADIKETYGLSSNAVLAAKSGNVELLKFIESLGLNILEPLNNWDDQAHKMLSAAAESGSVEMMKYLFEYHKLALISYVNKENNNKYAYEYNAYNTILGKAVGNSSFHGKYHGNNIPLIHYLFAELHLLPPKEALKKLKAQEAKFSGIQVNAYLESYLVDSEADKKLLLLIADKGLDAVQIPTLFRLYHSGLITEGNYNHFEDQIRKRIEEFALSNEQLSQLVKASKQFAVDALYYYSSYQYAENFEKLKFILQLGIDVNTPNEKGETVIQNAALSGGYNAIVKFLIANGADVDHASNDGSTLINVLGRQLGTDAEILTELLNYSKDYTNSLKQACKTRFDNSLSVILKHSKGEIGNATVEELVESGLTSGNLQELLMGVSKPVFATMESLLLKTEFLKQHNFSQEKVEHMLKKVKTKQTPPTQEINQLLGSCFNSLTAISDFIIKENEFEKIKTIAPPMKESKQLVSNEANDQKFSPLKKLPKASTSGLFSSTDIKDVSYWTGKAFGQLRAYRILDNNIRILLHTGGFAIFFPKEIWNKFDVQVNNYLFLPKEADRPCWIAGKDFTYLKIDTNINELSVEDKDYASNDNEVALNKIEGFVKKNFINNSQAFPDSDYFTLGSFARNPEMPRPFRMRMGGNFNLQF